MDDELLERARAASPQPRDFVLEWVDIGLSVVGDAPRAHWHWLLREFYNECHEAGGVTPVLSIPALAKRMDTAKSLGLKE